MSRPVVVCPRCGGSIRNYPGPFPDYCDIAGCSYTFPITDQRITPAASPQKPSLSPNYSFPQLPESRPITSPRLVAPYRCPGCHQAIHQSAGIPRLTITHECGNRTTLYAVLFYAECCGTALELPRAEMGRCHPCPNCKREFIGPRDDIVHRSVADIQSGTLMRFHCSTPSCNAPLTCNTIHHEKTVVGIPVVCPICHGVMNVPAAGEAISF